MYISAAEFKAKCLRLMDQVNDYHEEVVITKHGNPVAKLVPYSLKPKKSIFGYLENTVKVNDDIIKPLGESWEADE